MYVCQKQTNIKSERIFITVLEVISGQLDWVLGVNPGVHPGGGES